MKVLFAVIGYAIAMTLANLSIAAFGPWVSPINSFVFIGFDLVLRDWLHVRMKPWQMGALITATGILTYALNPAAQHIAIASAVSFAVAASADWFTFSRLRGSWARRSMGSNIVGAAVDSLIFPTLAFGVLMPAIVALQFLAKVVGGLIWTIIFRRSTPRGGDTP